EDRGSPEGVPEGPEAHRNRPARREDAREARRVALTRRPGTDDGWGHDLPPVGLASRHCRSPDRPALVCAQGDWRGRGLGYRRFAVGRAARTGGRDTAIREHAHGTTHVPEGPESVQRTKARRISPGPSQNQSSPVARTSTTAKWLSATSSSVVVGSASKRDG